MERLILEIDVGEEYVFSAQNHVPVVFSSKEEFLISLEDKLNEIIQQLPDLDSARADNSLKFQQILDNHRKKKKPSEKENKEFTEAFQKNREEEVRLRTVIEQLETFTLGGQQFKVDDFVNITVDEHNKLIRNIFLPRVYTLDEFFAEAELNNKNEQQLTKKVKP